jgi:hypothetical protein
LAELIEAATPSGMSETAAVACQRLVDTTVAGCTD